MEKLNWLLDLSKACHVIGAPVRLSDSQVEAITEAFRELEQGKVSAEHERDCHMDIADYFKERWLTQKQRAEAAEAKLAELEKQEPVWWLDVSVELPPETYPGRYRNDLPEAYLNCVKTAGGIPLFARPAPAADLAELVPDAKAIRKEAGSYAPVYSLQEQQLFIDGATWLSAAILRNIEEAE